MRRHYLISASVLAATPAFAQSAHPGLQVGLSVPQADARDVVAEAGITLGFNVAIILKGGHVLRPRLDFAQSTSMSWTSASNHLTTAMISLDYNWFMAGNPTGGLYLIAGLGYAQSKVQTSSNSSPYGGGNGGISAGAPSLAWGLGYQFTALIGTDLRYTTTQPSLNGVKFMNDAIKVGVTFTF